MKTTPLFFVALLLGSRCAAFATECFGPINAKANLVYLHGVDSVNPGALELSNRKVLQQIATNLGIRIALPRSPQQCNGTSLCWNPNDGSLNLARSLLSAAHEESKNCFVAGAPTHLLGFSSGGFLANKILRFCILPSGFETVTSVGSAGGTLNSDPMDLRRCQPLRMIISTTESTYPAAMQFMQLMKNRGGNVRMDYFASTHQVPLNPTLAVLHDQLGL